MDEFEVVLAGDFDGAHRSQVRSHELDVDQFDAEDVERLH